MKLSTALVASLLVGNVAAGLVTPPEPQREVRYRSAEPEFEPELEPDTTPAEELWKRRGGGGGGGGRGGGGSGGGRGGGSSGGSRGGSNSGSNTRGSSNSGGYSRDGTGPQPSFGGGQYYAGGSKVPYPAGGSPPGRSLNSYPGSLAFYPGFWPYGGFYYPYAYSHGYRNRTSNRNETRDIVCVCARYSVCACDDIDNKDFYDELIKDGDYDKLNKSMVTVSRVNGTQKIVINGTLPNGTTVPTDDEELYEMYLNGAVTLGLTVGYWPAAAAVMAAVLLA